MTSNFLVLWSLLFAEPTGQLSLFLMGLVKFFWSNMNRVYSVFVLGELGKDGVDGLVNWRRASVLLGRGFASQHGVEVVGSEFNSVRLKFSFLIVRK